LWCYASEIAGTNLDPELETAGINAPLPDQTYADLLADAERAHVPATWLAREAIDFWLSGQAGKVRHEAFVVYASEIAGTNLDPELDIFRRARGGS
jgi:hypothetical protein